MPTDTDRATRVRRYSEADIAFALEEAEKARDALDQALSGYGRAGAMERGSLALEDAFRAAEDAVREVKRDREALRTAGDEANERLDSERPEQGGRRG